MNAAKSPIRHSSDEAILARHYAMQLSTALTRKDIAVNLKGAEDGADLDFTFDEYWKVTVHISATTTDGVTKVHVSFGAYDSYIGDNDDDRMIRLGERTLGDWQFGNLYNLITAQLGKKHKHCFDGTIVFAPDTSSPQLEQLEHDLLHCITRVCIELEGQKRP